MGGECEDVRELAERAVEKILWDSGLDGEGLLLLASLWGAKDLLYLIPDLEERAIEKCRVPDEVTEIVDAAVEAIFSHRELGYVVSSLGERRSALYYDLVKRAILQLATLWAMVGEDMFLVATFEPFRHKKIADFVRRWIGREGRVLEVGFGAGYVLFEFARRGYETHGVDVSGRAVELVLKLSHLLGYEVCVVLGGIRMAPSSEYDAVVFSWLFHDLEEEEIRRMLRDARELVGDEGFVFVFDPVPLMDDRDVMQVAEEAGLRFVFGEEIGASWNHGTVNNVVALVFERERRPAW